MRTLTSSQSNFMNDSFGGLVVCQGKGKPTSSEHYKQMKKAIDANVSYRILADLNLGKY